MAKLVRYRRDDGSVPFTKGRLEKAIMSKLSPDVSHHQEEIAELREDRGLALG
jgi:hypothetical protein